MSGESFKVEDQSAVAAALGDPACLGVAGPVERFETHGAIVFLAGERAFKMKRAVRYPYMDFGTLEQRFAMCCAEIRVNRRLAPRLYLGVAPVLRDGGSYRVGEVLEPDAAAAVLQAVEWLVVMRRFDNRTLLSRLAESHALDPGIIVSLAGEIAEFHRRAERSYELASIAQYRESIAMDVQQMAAHEDCLDRDVGHALAQLLPASLERSADLVERRRASGAVRHGHGDLHLRNVCLFEGRPTMFDAIEFSQRMATIDILYDLAFLVMDLDHRGEPALANLVLNHWLWRVDEVAGASHLEALALLPMFLARRASIRAHVDAAAAATLTDPSKLEAACAGARVYQRHALEILQPQPVRLIGIGGLSGTGKTTLALALAPCAGRKPGAVVLRTDVERKRRAGIALEERMPAGAYTAKESQETYAAVLQHADTVLRAGHCAIVDGVFAREPERRALEDVARRVGVPFAGLWLEVDPQVAAERVERRSSDASDADAGVVRRQLGYDLGTIGWQRLDAGGALKETTAKAADRLGMQIRA